MPAPPEPRPILFVGDIQGCLDPFERLLEAAGFDPDHHTLLPVGDTINRGPQNLEVLRSLRRLGATPIRGNHEEGILRALRGEKDPGWLAAQTVSRDLLGHPEAEALLAWVASWPFYRQGPGWIAVHGGLHPTLPIEQTPGRFLCSVRVCDAQGRRPTDWDGFDETIPPGFAPWHTYYHGPACVIFGHWARRGLQTGAHFRGIDTGCVYGQKLTGLWWPADELVQVPA